MNKYLLSNNDSECSRLSNFYFFIKIFNISDNGYNASLWKDYFDNIEKSNDLSYKKICCVLRRIQGIFEVLHFKEVLKRRQIENYLPPGFNDYFVGQKLKAEIRSQVFSRRSPFLFEFQGMDNNFPNNVQNYCVTLLCLSKLS